MPERALLRDCFSQMQRASEDAAGRYEALAGGAGADAARDDLQRLARQKQRHVALTERLIEIVSE